MAVSGIIFQMITLFIMMFAGYLAARAGLISPSFRRGLSSLVLSTAFPCCIVSSVLQSGGAPGDMVVALGVSVAFFALMIALAAVLVCIVPTPKPERSLDQLMLVFTNLAFMAFRSFRRSTARRAWRCSPCSCWYSTFLSSPTA